MRRRALTTDEFIKRAREVHGERYDYSLVKYINARSKIQIICPEHGVFEQTPDRHFHGHGCQKCAVKNQRSNVQRFIKRARKIHGCKYNYSMVIYKDNKHPVMIICPEHGVFEQTPNGHLNGHGCSLCAIKQRLLTNEEFIKRAREVHGERYDYSLVKYINAQTKVKIICSEHGVFEQTPNNHTSLKHGCPKCTETGFNPSEPGTLYVLTDDKQCPTLLKVGVTNNLKQRLRQLRHTTPHPVVKLVSYPFPRGVDAYKLEQEVHQVFRELNAGMSGFNGATEWFKYSPAILDHIRDTISLS